MHKIQRGLDTQDTKIRRGLDALDTKIRRGLDALDTKRSRCTGYKDGIMHRYNTLYE